MRHARNRSLLAALALSSVVVAVVAAAPSQAADEVPVPALTGLPTPGDPVDVEANFTIIDEQLLEPHPEEWGGAYVDGDTLVVKTVTRSVADATAVLAGLGVTRGVTVVPSTISQRDLTQVADAIVADPTSTDSVLTVAPEYSQSRVVVAVAPATAPTVVDRLTSRTSTLALLQAQARPTRPIGTRPGIPVPQTRTSSGDEAEPTTAPAPPVVPVTVYGDAGGGATSRYYDSAPFYGGAAIGLGSASKPIQSCTSAFAWNSPYTSTTGHLSSYMITAAHCTTQHSGSRYTGVYRLASASSAGAVRIGTVTWTSANNNGTRSGMNGDLAAYLVSTNTAAPRDYIGSNNTSASLPITGRTTLPQNWKGGTLRTSGGSGPLYGKSDGETNPDWISLTGVRKYWGNVDQWYTNLTIAEDSNECTGSGDSGGAVYLRSASGTTAKAVGVLSGSSGSAAGLLNCKMYFTPIKYVAQGFGGSITTS